MLEAYDCSLWLCNNQATASTLNSPGQKDYKDSHCANQDFSGCMNIAKLLWHAWNWPMYKQAMGNCGASELNIPWGSGQMLGLLIIWPPIHSYSMVVCARRGKRTKSVVYCQAVASYFVSLHSVLLNPVYTLCKKPKLFIGKMIVLGMYGLQLVPFEVYKFSEI